MSFHCTIIIAEGKCSCSILFNNSAQYFRAQKLWILANVSLKLRSRYVKLGILMKIAGANFNHLTIVAIFAFNAQDVHFNHHHFLCNALTTDLAYKNSLKTVGRVLSSITSRYPFKTIRDNTGITVNKKIIHMCANIHVSAIQMKKIVWQYMVEY